MTKQETQSAEDLDRIEQVNLQHNINIFEIKADVWEAPPLVAPILVHHQMIHRQQYYTGDA